MTQFFYNLLWNITWPFWKVWTLWRYCKGKEKKGRIAERFGNPSKLRPHGKLIWMHGASIGEIISLEPVITYFKTHYSEYKILLTSGTVTAAYVIKKKYSDLVIHQFIPLDHPHWVKKFFNYWKPDLGIIAESEFWPNLILKATCPMWLLSGRLTEKSFQYWYKINKTLIKKILHKFQLIISQTAEDAYRFKKVLNKDVPVFNLKFAAKPLSVDQNSIQSIKKEIGDRPFWIAASTHHDEEEIIAKAYILIKEVIPQILTIIIPRHPIRTDYIKNLFKTFDFNIALRSSKEKITAYTDIYIGDTLGELGTFYALQSITFLGGSLFPHVGGHNLLEAAYYKNALLTGPYMHKALDIQQLFLQNHGCMMTRNAAEIADYVITLLQNPDFLKERQNQSYSIMKNIQKDQQQFWSLLNLKMRELNLA